MSYNRKPIPKSILIFGAADHIGGPLAALLMREAPSIRLRVATRSESRAEELRQKFPAAEVVRAEYSDLPSLTKAVEGMEGVFFITPGGPGDQEHTRNLVTALKASGTLVHMIRLLGTIPEVNTHRMRPTLKGAILGIDIRYTTMKQILDESGLPVTYLNSGATFMDNFMRLGQARLVQSERKLVWPERLVPWIDPRDIAEVAGRLFLSDNHRHIGQFHTMNNGHDLLRFRDVAQLMSEVYGEPISYDGSKEGFFAAYPYLGPIRDFLWEFFEHEQDNEVAWSLNDFVERTLGRKPKTLREWLVEHRNAVLGTT